MPIVVRKVSQIVGLLLLMSTLFLILSVSVYTPEAPNANHYVSDGSTMGQHRGGVVRKVLADWADWALQGFGSVVVLLTGIAVIETCCLLRWRLGAAVAVAGRGLLCLGAVSARGRICCDEVGGARSHLLRVEEREEATVSFSESGWCPGGISPRRG